MQQKLSNTKSRIGQLVIQLFLIAGCFVVLLPIFWAISSSLKPLDAIFVFPVKWIPDKLLISNYVEGWRAARFNLYFLNSVFVTVVCTVSVLLFSALTGYSLAKFRFPGRKILFGIIIGTMLVPIQVRVIPLYIIVKTFGWINTYLALIVPGLITSIGIFMMTQFIKVLPGELFDAARVDGCHEFTVFFRIVLPLAKPGLAALAIVNYMAVWNDYFWPLVVIDKDSLRTLPLGLAAFQGEYFFDYGKFFAVSLMVILPMVLIFLIFQKQFIESAALSGIKG